MSCTRWPVAVLLALMLAPLSAISAAAPVHIEEMTWTELRERIGAGATTVLVPIGGTEQNGPHMVLGKHNVRVRVLAERIARGLGNVVAAPVMAYVPEGDIDPPAAHMRYTGTLSISDAAFESVLESTARSLCRHGFRDVVLLGDHGGYQKSLQQVAARLNRDWAPALKGSAGCRVHALTEYYRAVQTDYVAALRARGFTDEEIGSHAGLADTALALAVAPSLVRAELLAVRPASEVRSGVSGNPARATTELGELGAQIIVQASVKAIKTRTQRPR